jgi:hypothetical protein
MVDEWFYRIDRAVLDRIRMFGLVFRVVENTFKGQDLFTQEGGKRLNNEEKFK